MSPNLRITIIIGSILVVLGVAGMVVFLRWQATRDLDVPPSTTGEAVSERDRAKLEAEEQARIASYPADTDGDGLSDVQEQQLGTDQRNADTDKDGATDLVEVLRQTDPKTFDEIKPDERPSFGTAVAGTEASGVSEASAGGSASSQPSVTSDDADQDGLMREQELQLGTDPAVYDSDGDGVGDGQEVNTYRTNPQNRDSDADGYPDGDEIKNGYNPLGPGPCAAADCKP